MSDKVKKSQEKIEEFLPKGSLLEYDKLNPFLRRILLEYSSKQFYDVVEDSLVMDIVTMLSILACSKRVEIESPLGYPRTFPNFYLIRLMPSSYGKDSPFDIMMEDLFSEIREELETEYLVFVNSVREKPYLLLPKLKESLFNICQSSDPEKLKETYESLKRDDYLRKIPEPHSFLFEMSNATLQGFASYLEWLELFGKGCAFLKMSEFGSYITGDDENKKDFLTGLNNAWENKPVETKKLKGERYSLVNRVRVPTIVMGNSSSFWIKEEKERAKLYTFLNMGYGRRFFVFQPKDVVSKQKSEMTLEEEIEIMENSIRLDGVKEVLKEELLTLWGVNNRLLLWDRDAMRLFYYYKVFNGTKADEYVVKGEDEHPIASELKGRAEVCIKIAGIFAVASGSNRITREHVGQAIYFVERYKNQTLSFLEEQFQVETITQKLFNFIRQEPRNRQQIKERNIIPQGSFYYAFDKEIQELRDYCNSNGYILKESVGKYNSRTFSIVFPEETNENEIPLMVADEKSLDEMTKNTTYRKIFTTWEDLPKVLRKYAYMPQLNNGHRSKKDAIEGGVLLALDIDDNWTLDEAKRFLEENRIKSLMITTKSHQKSVSKDGKRIEPRDKFRIIILLASPFTGDSNTWSRVVSNVINKFGGIADAGCKDISRFFYPSPADAIYYYIDGEPLRWQDFDFESRSISALDRAINYAQAKYGVVNEGNRDTFLNEIWYYNFKEQGVSQAETYEICKELNRRFCNPPFSDREMKKWDRNK